MKTIIELTDQQTDRQIDETNRQTDRQMTVAKQYALPFLEGNVNIS